MVLEALRDIDVGEEITMDYDARASETAKDTGLTFWRWRPPSSPVAEGLNRIKCACAGDGRTCPRNLWRDERSIQSIPNTTRGSCRVQGAISSGRQTGKRSFQGGAQLEGSVKQARVQRPVLSSVDTIAADHTAAAVATVTKQGGCSPSLPGRSVAVSKRKLESGCSDADLEPSLSGRVGAEESERESTSVVGSERVALAAGSGRVLTAIVLEQTTSLPGSDQQSGPMLTAADHEAGDVAADRRQKRSNCCGW